MPPDPPLSDQADSEDLPSSPDQAVVLEVNSSESSSESEDDFAPGYIQLPQDGDSVADDDSPSGENLTSNVTSLSTIKDQREAIMPPEQADLIKATMAKLPPPKTPHWAQTIPEEKWMGEIIAKIYSTSAPSAATNEESGFANFEEHFQLDKTS